MNLNDLFPTADEAASLKRVDQLVDEGLSRHRAEKLIARLEAYINGPWADLLESLSTPEGCELDPERGLVQTFFIAYVDQWAADRMFMVAFAQRHLLAHFASIDSPEKD